MREGPRASSDPLSPPAGERGTALPSHDAAAATGREGAAGERLGGNRSFRLFLASRVMSSLAFQALAIAMGWLIYDLTKSAFMLGFVGLCQFLPMLVLTFVAGPVADRFDRRIIVCLCQFAEAATCLVLAVLAWTDALTASKILIAVTVLGAAQAFERPTLAALLPSLVPERLFPSAIAVSTSMMQTAMIVGPAAGGLLYGIDGRLPFAVGLALFAFAGLAIFAIRPVARERLREPVTLESVFAGVRYIRSRPVLLGSISLDMFAVLLGGAVALMPIFASDILKAGPLGLGFLRAAPAIGALSMSIYLARYPLVSGAGRKMLYGVAVFGLATIVFGFSTSVVLSVIALAVAGAADTISVVVRFSLVQLMTPDEMRGRVSAVNALFIGTSNQLGEFESGILAGLVGPVAACVLGGVGTLGIVAAWTRLFPELARVESLAGPRP